MWLRKKLRKQEVIGMVIYGTAYCTYMSSCLICVHGSKIPISSSRLARQNSILNSMHTNQAAWLVLVHWAVLWITIPITSCLRSFFTITSHPYFTCLNLQFLVPLVYIWSLLPVKSQNFPYTCCIKALQSQHWRSTATCAAALGLPNLNYT